MSVDVFILNTGVADFRGSEFAFTDELVGPGGLALGETKDMPGYTQQDYKKWIDDGRATAGGPGNTAPLIARAGLDVAVGVNFGKGNFDGLDAQGRYFYDTMTDNNIDMSQAFVHPQLPTGTTFIYEKDSRERGGIVYFPNANNDFDFEYFKGSVEKLNPNVVYYMYSGLSKRGDANVGIDLADFISWCKGKGIVTIVDSHTLTGNPQELIDTDAAIDEYRLLEPLLSKLDLFFTSYDEARMIENTIGQKGLSKNMSEDQYICHFLDLLSEKFWKDSKKPAMFGVTVSNGAFIKHTFEGRMSNPIKIESNFMAGEVMDLVGAGDSFRAGFISYVAKNIKSFKAGIIDYPQAVQMGNLFASLYIKAPLDNRYGNIGTYEKMFKIVQGEQEFRSFDELITAAKN